MTETTTDQSLVSLAVELGIAKRLIHDSAAEVPIWAILVWWAPTSVLVAKRAVRVATRCEEARTALVSLAELLDYDDCDRDSTVIAYLDSLKGAC